VDPRIRSLVNRFERVPAGWWVVLSTLPALVPLGRTGFFQSHDGLFHVFRMVALDKAVRGGVLYPRWFPQFAFGYGQPVFNFYGPLSYYLGLPFTLLGADAVLAMKLVLVGGLCLSSLGMYLFARRHMDRGPSLVAAVVYAYIPYHLVDLYVRGAVAEFLAFAWFPLILWGVHRLIEDSDRSLTSIAVVALLLTALLLTHGLSLLVFAPVLAVYVALLLMTRRDRRAAGRVGQATVLSVAMSTCYWLPVLAESQYVGLGHGVSEGYRNHLLPLADLLSTGFVYSYQLEPGAPITFPLGSIQALIIGAASLLLFRAHRLRWLVLFFLVVALVSAFLLTTSALPIWQILEGGLAWLQYPWRFQVLTTLATAFLAGALVHGLARPTGWTRVALGTTILLATGIWAVGRLPITRITPDLSTEGMWGMDRDLGQVGTTWTGEYLPIWVNEQRWAISLSPETPPSHEERVPSGQVRLTGVGYARFDLEVNASQDSTLVLHQFHYPGWQARWQGEVIPSYPRGDLGLAAFDLSAGTGPLTIQLHATPIQSWAMVISVLVLLAGGGALVARFGTTDAAHPRQRLLLPVCLLLPAAVLLASLLLPNGYLRSTHQVAANLQDSIELLAFLTDEDVYCPGDTVRVTLYWRALRSLDQDYKASIHITDDVGARQLARHDGDPGGGYTPTTRWLPGELVSDTHTVALPEDLPPGRYRIWASMYEFATVRNLEVISVEGTADGSRILLGEIRVVST
jgi:hypothetical protein